MQTLYFSDNLCSLTLHQQVGYIGVDDIMHQALIRLKLDDSAGKVRRVLHLQLLHHQAVILLHPELLPQPLIQIRQRQVPVWIHDGMGDEHLVPLPGGGEHLVWIPVQGVDKAGHRGVLTHLSEHNVQRWGGGLGAELWCRGCLRGDLFSGGAGGGGGGGRGGNVTGII